MGFLDKLFGSNKVEKETKKIETIVEPPKEDGKVVNTTGFGYYQYGMTSASYDSHENAVKIWRDTAQLPEVAFAIDEIVNEMVDFNERTPIEIDFNDNTDVSEQIKKKIIASFDKIIPLVSFKLYENIKRWYIDGSRAWIVQLSEDGKEIEFIRSVEPWQIKKIIPVKQTIKNGINVYIEEESYFVYLQKTKATTKEIKIPNDYVLYTDSGLYDNKNDFPISYLTYAVKPSNDLINLENATVIYRMTRAPEKRAFYVDTGQLPTAKAQEYLTSLMNKFKTKLEYDPASGKIKSSNRNVIPAVVDYFIPRREGSNATDIEILSESNGGLSNIIDDLEYFKKKLYRALFIPTNRLESDSTFGFGKEGIITREEVKFSQFIARLRDQYIRSIYDVLKLQLKLDGVIKEEEWEDIKKAIEISFKTNDFFAETKRRERINEIADTINNLENYVGKYFSHQYVLKEIVGLTDDEIETMREQIKQEREDEIYSSSDDENY